MTFEANNRETDKDMTKKLLNNDEEKLTYIKLI